MKAYFLPLGAGADRSLPAMLAALSCGAAREVPSAAMLRVSYRFSCYAEIISLPVKPCNQR